MQKPTIWNELASPDPPSLATTQKYVYNEFAFLLLDKIMNNVQVGAFGSSVTVDQKRIWAEN